MSNSTWLEDTFQDVSLEMSYMYSPSYMVQMGLGPITLPIDKKQTQLLYEKMNERFYQWTGKQLKHYDPDSSNHT